MCLRAARRFSRPFLATFSIRGIRFVSFSEQNGGEPRVLPGSASLTFYAIRDVDPIDSAGKSRIIRRRRSRRDCNMRFFYSLLARPRGFLSSRDETCSRIQLLDIDRGATARRGK